MSRRREREHKRLEEECSDKARRCSGAEARRSLVSPRWTGADLEASILA